MTDPNRGDVGAPASRLSAKLGHSDNVRCAESRDDGSRVFIRVVNSGIRPRETETIRQLGFQIAAVNMRHNYVSVNKRCCHD